MKEADADRGRPEAAPRGGDARLLARSRRHLGRPVDAASLGAFRFWFGLCLAVEALRFFGHGWIRRYYIDVALTLPLPGFGFLKPWPGPGMYIHFAVLGLAGVAVMLGIYYRLAITVLFLAFSYIFLLEEAHYLNHFYFITLLAFLLLWMPADRWGAVRWRALPGARAAGAPATVPNWTVFLLRAQLFIVYFYAGIAKLNPDWLHGEPIGTWLAQSGDVRIIGPLLTRPWMVPLFVYGGLLYDLSVPFLLAWPRTRLFGLVWSFLFHILNLLIFDIGIFPWLAMGATLIFAEPDWPRRAIRAVGRWCLRADPSLGTAAPAGTLPASPAPPAAARPASWATTAFVIGYLALQVLVPFRHWLYPGDVAWTEEGHILSWRMKLRDKEGEIRAFAVVDPRTGRKTAHDPRQVLTARQYGKMVTRPRLLLRYVDWLADRHEREKGVRPRIYVDLWASLNGRKYQRLVDPNADLAAASLSLLPSPWIVPLTTPLSEREEFDAEGEGVDE